MKSTKGGYEQDDTNCHNTNLVNYPSPSQWSQASVSPLASPATSPWTKTSLLQCSSSPRIYREEKNNLVTFECVATILKHNSQIYSLAMAPGGVIYAGNDRRSVAAWRHPELTECSNFRAGTGPVKALLPAGDKILTAHNDGKVRVWRRSCSKPGVHRRSGTLPRKGFLRSLLTRESSHTGEVTCLAYNPVEDLLYSGSSDCTVRVWSLTQGKCLHVLKGHVGGVNAVAIREDGVLLTASDDGTVKVWKPKVAQGSIQTHDMVATVFAQHSPVRALATWLCRDGDGMWVMYAGCSDGYIYHWEDERPSSKTMHYGGHIRGHGHAVLCLSVVEDVLVSGSADNSIKVWRRDANGGCIECISVLTGHHAPVRCLATAFDLLRLRMIVYSGGLDGAIHVWTGDFHRDYFLPTQACATDDYFSIT